MKSLRLEDYENSDCEECAISRALTGREKVPNRKVARRKKISEHLVICPFYRKCERIERGTYDVCRKKLRVIKYKIFFKDISVKPYIIYKKKEVV